MILYHGTTAAAVPKILKEGILPRQISGAQPSSQCHELQGHPECVYLANAYTSFYAAEAAKSPEGIIGEAAILEIDTDLLDNRLFLPDHFFMAQLADELPYFSRKSHEKVIAKVHAGMTELKLNWRVFFEIMGTCSYRGIIPPSAIKRTCFIDFSIMHPAMLAEIINMCAPLIALVNKYRMIDAWFWGGEVEYRFGLLPHPQSMYSERAIKAFRKLWSDRSMVRIEECS